MTTTEILTGIKNWVVGKLNLKQNVISDLADIRSGAQAGATSVQPADILSYFDNAVYDSSTHRINFYHGQSVIAYVDASPFIVDGMVNDVRIENGYLVIDFNTDSGKQDISIPLTDIFDPSNYYNKTQTDTLLSNKVDKVSGKGLSTNDYTNAEKEKLSGLQNYDDTQVRQLIAQKQDIIQDLATIRSGANSGATAVQPTTLNSALSNTVAESGVYDVTANNNNAKFADLSSLLSSQNLNTLIPTDIRRGGMSIKFVQSIDNKYVQYFLNAQSFTTDVSEWEKMNLEKEFNNLVNGKDDRNYIPNKIVDANGIIQDNSGTIVSLELTNILGKTVNYISNVGYIAYYKQDGTLYQRYVAQSTRSLDIPGSNVVHHVIASFDAADSTYGIKQGDEWLYYPSGDTTYGLTEIQVRTAILSDALCYSNIVYNGELIVSASVKYPDNNEGSMSNVIYSGSKIVSVDYSYGTDTYRVSLSYDGDKVTSNIIEKI